MTRAPRLSVINPRYDPPDPRAGPWADKLMRTLQPGGTWVVPRSVSTVRVLSTMPPVATSHCIFPDPLLLITLREAGWLVQTHTKTY